MSKSNKKAKNPNPYQKKAPSKIPKYTCIALAAIILAGAFGYFKYQTKQAAVQAELDRLDTPQSQAYQAASDALRTQVLSEIPDQGVYNIWHDKCIVFLSYSDTKYMPFVRHAAGKTIEETWDDVDNQLKELIYNSKNTIQYLKCDIVTTAIPTSYADVRTGIRESATGQYNYGAAFDKDFKIAMLSQEANGYRVYDKTQNNVMRPVINDYLTASRTGLSLEKIPDTITLFQTDSWLYECENESTTKLSTNDMTYGIRDFELTKANIGLMIATSGNYLENNLFENGEFVYEFFPQANTPSPGYNIIRHTVATWAICQYCDIAGSALTQTQIQRAIRLIEDHLVTTEDGKTYVQTTDDEDEPGQIRMGVMGTTIAALVEYQKLFNDDRYIDIVDALATTLVSDMRPNGSLPHWLSKDFTVEEESAVQFYDGECLTGLCYAYEATGNEEYLAAAQKLAKYCIDSGHGTIGDHWFAIGLNELTKYLPDHEEYYQAVLTAITRQDDEVKKYRNEPTRLEQLVCGFELYERALENNINIPDEFDIKRHLKNLQTNAKALTNNYLFPEKAIYSPSFQSCVGTFYQEDKETWSIRIDMIQHHIDGFYKLFQNYDAIQTACAKYGIKFK